MTHAKNSVAYWRSRMAELDSRGRGPKPPVPSKVQIATLAVEMSRDHRDRQCAAFQRMSGPESVPMLAPRRFLYEGNQRIVA